MPFHLRKAQLADAGAMAEILNDIIAIGGTTTHRDPFDAHGIVETFIAPKLGISCFVALEGAQLLGFQALEWCDPDWPGPDRLPADWAVIATYVTPQAHKSGVGRALFAKTALGAKAFCDLTESRRIAKTRRNKDLEQTSVHA